MVLAENGRSAYTILIPENPSKLEKRSAEVLQDYFYRVTGVSLVVQKERETGRSRVISIGNTGFAGETELKKPRQESFRITAKAGDLVIKGGSGQGLLYGVYTLVEKFLGCRKWYAGEPPYVPERKRLTIPADTEVEEAPAFVFREVYFPGSWDDEYLAWHKLHRFTDLWGIWGHSFEKLVPSSAYFKDHPEYYALVNGERKPVQLCLSNEDVLEITVNRLKKTMEQKPYAIYWSVSPNDDIGYCECDRCRAVDEHEGGPQGSLIRFVNRVARRFPDKIFTTLAYTYSARPPLHTAPADNVYIMLSSIDAYRTEALSVERSAAGFRNNLRGWKQKTGHIMVWDYYTQFTNYLAPFPDIPTLEPNVQYLSDQEVKGVFAQGSGSTYSDMAELKGYLLAKLLWNPGADVDKLTRDFLKGYYGQAAPLVEKYLAEIRADIVKDKVNLSIYGNPVNDHNTYLSPEKIDRYSTLMNRAEAAVEGDSARQARVRRLRLTHEYTVLQQARLYGLEKHGIFEHKNGRWKVRDGFPERVGRFVKDCEEAGVEVLSEGGRSPGEYKKEWAAIFKEGVRPNLARGGEITEIKYPPAEEYPAKERRTLTDGVPGYDDFSYNWLCFYGVPMEVVVDLKKTKKVRSVEMNFLEDPRHWIFRPETVTISVSQDGKTYRDIKILKNESPEENYSIRMLPHTFSLPKEMPVRFIKIKAVPPASLPAWRHHNRKKPMIACDEVWVE
ncbi:DUF4838 domain-containing protein [Sinomicrobium weinanense]|uniref:DUF4838 domain-containing protein n=1 Tax=Sinomicrobium weinanense TaxID=2842200 RepID=A0A926JRP6_9FLAO|nr:DUF4838 domain-containing protein [Sinomicrobium weinanense]MBC9796047.1 DUF4838 domain-containing protein [Sinomicrobium weinanense]MBU3123134.1 DUF4838 domain-containing protein [Sinomicrobium weinanense]